MSEEHVIRAQLAGLRVQRIQAEASRTTDPERMAELVAEAEVLHQSLLDIREEQLLENLERVQPKPKKKRWWKR